MVGGSPIYGTYFSEEKLASIPDICNLINKALDLLCGDYRMLVHRLSRTRVVVNCARDVYMYFVLFV